MSNAPPFKRGDVVLVPFPFTDLTGQKRRPAIVLAVGAHSDDVILAFISSIVPKTLAKADVLLQIGNKHFKQTGLKVSSIIRLNKLATIEKRLIRRRLGKLHATQLPKIDRALIAALEIDVNHLRQQS